MKLYRYFVKYLDRRKDIGIFMAGYDLDLIAKSYNRSSIEALDLREESLGWLVDPDTGGEYWFTEQGNRIFKERSFKFLVDGLPRTTPKSVHRIVLDLEEIPNWEKFVNYTDEYQIAFIKCDEWDLAKKFAI